LVSSSLAIRQYQCDVIGVPIVIATVVEIGTQIGIVIDLLVELHHLLMHHFEK
jgi:hypothetical protein